MLFPIEGNHMSIAYWSFPPVQQYKKGSSQGATKAASGNCYGQQINGRFQALVTGWLYSSASASTKHRPAEKRHPFCPQRLADLDT